MSNAVNELTDDESIALSMFLNEVGDKLTPEEALNTAIEYLEKYPNGRDLLFNRGVHYIFKRASIFGLGLPRLTHEGEIELYQLFNDGHLPDRGNTIIPTHIPYDLGAIIKSSKSSRVTAWLLWN